VKPCGLFNIDGFFAGLLLQLKRMVQDRFLRPEQLDQLIVEDRIEKMVERIMVAKPVVIDKWIDKDKIAI